MKSPFLLKISAWVLTAIGGNISFAQQAQEKSLAINMLSSAGIADTTLMSNSGMANNNEAAKINPKTITAFNKKFKNAVNLKWYEIKKSFLASFTEEGKQTHALLDKKGRIIYTVTYGTEKDLPHDIRKLIRANYIDETINMAVEINEDNRNIWVVKLENSSNLIFARVENGILEEVKNYRKSL